MFEHETKEHPPCGNEAAYRYRVRLGFVLHRFNGGPLKAVYGCDPSMADGVDPGCLDAPEWMPAGGMESDSGGWPRWRSQLEWRREYWRGMH